MEDSFDLLPEEKQEELLKAQAEEWEKMNTLAAELEEYAERME